MRNSRSIGAVWGLPAMKFTLTYDGPLPSSGNKSKPAVVWEIRKAFHPQLKDLWQSHPALRQVEGNRYFPKYGGATLTQGHHLHPTPLIGVKREEFGVIVPPDTGELLDLCEPLPKHGTWFVPLVRDSYALHCGLKVLFLRKEAPGKVYQGGDVDGRIKTLIDALTAPQHREQVLEERKQREDAIYCLMEDDSLVSGLAVESERLLTDQNHDKDFVRLVIEVDVRVRLATIYNQSFL